jgi:hypothetical protein
MTNRIQGKQKNKPWHMQSAVEQLHKKMKESIKEWLNAYFIRESPEWIKGQIVTESEQGMAWLKENGYHWEHTRIRHISPFAFAMVFELNQKDLMVNEFEFIITHDGGIKNEMKFASQVFVGVYER